MIMRKNGHLARTSTGHLALCPSGGCCSTIDEPISVTLSSFTGAFAWANGTYALQQDIACRWTSVTTLTRGALCSGVCSRLVGAILVDEVWADPREIEIVVTIASTAPNGVDDIITVAVDLKYWFSHKHINYGDTTTCFDGLPISINTDSGVTASTKLCAYSPLTKTDFVGTFWADNLPCRADTGTVTVNVAI